jgi:hypothetical protein
MSGLNFADSYAQAGLAPGGTIITARQPAATRILADLKFPRKFDLVQLYFGQPDLDLIWLRDEFVKEDAAFSLVNNQRECVVLAATMLDAQVAAGDGQTILALLTASVSGKRPVVEFSGLLDKANAALLSRAVADRQPAKIDSNLKISATHPKLAEEIAAIPLNDWPNLIVTLGKMRTEAADASKAIATQASTTLGAMNSQLLYMREETQMLWWLFGEHSRTLKRHFSTFHTGIAAIVAAIDLGDLTTASMFGPIAAPAMLERILRLTRPSDGESKSLAAVVDAASPSDLQALNLLGKDQPPCIFPIMTAIRRARENPGSWHAGFEAATGTKATTEFEPIELATQIYYEHLLGQLL